MHEISLAQGIIKTAEETLKNEGAKEIISITICIGTLSGVIQESLEFCFPLMTKETVFQNTKLIIEKLPIKIECTHCKQQNKLDKFNLECPHCKSKDVQIISGKEFYIANMEII